MPGAEDDDDGAPDRLADDLHDAPAGEAFLLGPGLSMVGVAVLMNPAARAACLSESTGAGVSVGDVPDHLDARTWNRRAHYDWRADSPRCRGTRTC